MCGRIQNYTQRFTTNIIFFIMRYVFLFRVKKCAFVFNWKLFLSESTIVCHLLQYVYLLASREKAEKCKLQNLEYPVPDVQMRKSRPLKCAELANQKIKLTLSSTTQLSVPGLPKWGNFSYHPCYHTSYYTCTLQALCLNETIAWIERIC